MLRILFAAGIAGLVFAGGSGIAQSAPILPLPAGATSAIDNMTDVQWGRCWRDRWGRLRCPGGWGPGWGAWGWSGGPGWGAPRLGRSRLGAALLARSLGPLDLQIVIPNALT